MDDNPPSDLPARVQTMQIIVVALTMGLVFFLAIVCFVGPAFNMGAAFGGLPVLTMIALVLAATDVVARTIVVSVMVGSARGKMIRQGPIAGGVVASDAEQLVALYQTRMIVSAALLEGGAFFLLIAYMLDRSPVALVAAFGLILGVAAHFPTRERVSAFIERQMSLIEQERQFGAA